MSNKRKITKEDVKSAIRRLRRRKSYTKDSDITITLIAKEVGCSRNALYRSEFKDILHPFHKIKKNTEKEKHTKGSNEDLMSIISSKDDEIAKCKQELGKLKDWTIDKENMSTEIDKLIAEVERLQEKVSEMYSPEEVKKLASDNARLRELLLRNGVST
ncbi:hypothetical protein MN086_10590 [Sulfurovum sp. XGS-02]|uniref:hypothetical protein n=1 Tax=Sulfurovum sp. XGS-02 TaxID=2925411 RepID=UPI002070E5B3|nr:hypothetical protein [Sulfurovum sp. XGS-02]UPT77481.1 hypothetical protein MN086_10590 [Sulfurovum sp. XGS-02]